MVNFNKYFDRIYVINLDRRPDRFKSFQKEIDKYGIKNVERFSAIDGSTISPINNKLLIGEIGILQSHLEIIKKCREDGLNNVLIMEDDVYFSDEILKLDEYMESVPRDWEFLYFGGNHFYGKQPELINDKIIKLNYTVALQCVAINSSVFKVIESILPEMQKQVDTYYADLQNTFNSYGVYPNIAKQVAGFSDIQNKNVDYTNFFK
jgi:GR25 family glycosyltransferase involved in LPS biosynthesis